MVHQARPLRSVPRVLGLSGMQDDAKADRHQAGRPEGGQAGPDPRREMPALQLESGGQAGPLRRVHGVHQISRRASTSSTRRPAWCARRTATRAARSSSANRSAARCSSAARTIPTATSCSGTGRSPRPARNARAPYLDREDHQDATAARFSATTRTATTPDPKSSRKPARVSGGRTPNVELQN